MNERILIIDDEETLCYFLKESLEENGYQAVAAHTAREGLEVVTKQQIDLVLLDLKLPDGDGLNVLYEIKKEDSDLPVIVLTGHAAVESAAQAMKLGAHDYLEKPVNLDQLTFSMAEALKARPRGPVEVSLATITHAGDPASEGADGADPAGGGYRSWGQWAEMSRMYRELERQTEQVLVVDSISSDIMRSLEIDELIERVVDGLIELSAVDMAAVFLSDEDGRELVLAGQRRFPLHVWEDLSLRRVSAEGVESATARSAGAALPLGEVGPDPWSERLNSRLGNDVATLLVPLRDQAHLWGLIVIGRRGRQPFESAQIQTFCTVAERLALAVAHVTRLSSLGEQATQLLERETLHDSILRNMTNGLVVVDKGGRVRLVNRAGERMLGCRASDAIDKSVEEVLGPGAEIVRGSLLRALAYSGEEVVVERHGRESIPLGMSVSPLREDGGKLNGVVVVLSDLSKAKELEEERRRLDRLTLLREISAVVAHEIRNPLAGMGAGIQHLLTKFDEGDERREAMERILGESERVNRIIEDILLISRPPRLTLAPCDISEVIDDVISSWQEKAGAQGVEIRKYYAPELPSVGADKMGLHQALSNLVSNGMEAMPDGGELSIAVTGPGRAEVVDSGEGSALWGDGGYVEVEISDTGVGIKEDEIGRIFEPFYSTKARGAGLGLAITRRIINEHGGEVEVESEEGEGARFIVRLPLARSGG